MSQNKNILPILLGVSGVLLLLSKNKSSTKENSTEKAQTTNEPATTNPYERYKWTVAKGAILKTNTQTTVKAGPGSTYPVIVKVFPNTIIGRATGKQTDLEGFRWIEVELSSEVNLVSTFRIQLMEASINAFWIIQDHIGQLNKVVSIHSNPFLG